MRRRYKSNTELSLTKTTGEIARNRAFQKPSETRKAKKVRFDDAETDASSRGHEATESPRCWSFVNTGGGSKTSEYAYFRKVKDAAVNGQFRLLHKENEQLKSSKMGYLLRDIDKASEKIDPGMKDLNFSISGEIPEPSVQKLIVSPPVCKYDELYEIREKELTHNTKTRSSLLTETVTPIRQSLFSPELSQATKQSENQCIEKGIFTEKRRKLRQWVASTTSPEVEKLREKGADLVSFLLCRLIPKNNEDNDSPKGDAGNNNKPLKIHKSDNLEKGLPLPHKRDCHEDLPQICSGRSNEIVLRERDSFDSVFPSTNSKESDLLNEIIDRPEGSSEIVLREWDGFDSWFASNYCKEGALQNKIRDGSERSSDIVLREWDGFDSRFASNNRKERNLQCKTMDCFERSSEIVLGERDGFDSRFASKYRKESDHLNKTMDPDQYSDSRVSTRSDTRHGLSFCIPFERFRSLGAFHFKDLDEFSPIRGRGGEEPYRHSLEWDFEFGKERADHGTRKEKDVCHKLANTWSVDQQRTVDNVLDIKGLSPSPLFSSSYLFNSLPNCVSSGCLMHEDGPNSDDMKYAMVESGHSALAFPSSPKCIPLAEDVNADNVVSNSNLVLSYRDIIWPKKKVWDCMPQPDFLWKCLSAPELSAEDQPSSFHAWQSPQMEDSCSLSLLKEASERPFTSLYEGAFGHYPYSSTLHSPLDTFMNCPLLLNHVSQDLHDQELYSDDYDNELGYRRMF